MRAKHARTNASRKACCSCFIDHTAPDQPIRRLIGVHFLNLAVCNLARAHQTVCPAELQRACVFHTEPYKVSEWRLFAWRQNLIYSVLQLFHIYDFSLCTLCIAYALFNYICIGIVSIVPILKRPYVMLWIWNL